MKGKGIGLVHPITVVSRYHMVFVRLSFANLRNERFPNSRLAARMKFMTGLVPAVEVPHHVHLLRIRRPNRKIGARNSVHRSRVSAEPLVQLNVTAFVKQVEIVIGD